MNHKLESLAKPETTDRDTLADSLDALALHRRDVILEAVAASAAELLRASDLKGALPRVVERFGQAAGIDRVHVLELDTAEPSERMSVRDHHVWNAPGNAWPPELFEPCSTMMDIGLGSWIARLARGEAIAGQARDFDPAARDFFGRASVKSVLCVPVYVEDQWWGMVGFDDCWSERDWLASEIDTIKILAELVGATIARARRMQELVEAGHLVETSISERMVAERKMIELARTDHLTGLPNRVAFLERLHLGFARARRGDSLFAVLSLDLDHFKHVNDTLGHPAGDALLKAVAHRLKSCVRETDMVCRLGGDEFAVLQEDIESAGSAEVVARKICKAIALPFSIEGSEVKTTASVGVVPFRADVDAPEAMLMKADLALCRAKDGGRDQFRIHVDDFDQEMRERVAISDDLHMAIERDELDLYYQPQVDLATGQIVGLEALMWWNHPARGLLPSAAFIPVAEANGSIVEIGQWAIERACRQVGMWRDQGIAPRVVAVNISAGQFRSPGGLDRIVAEGLAKYDVPPGRLELELTEQVLLETMQRHGEDFERLRRIGIGIAVDDFGVGYASFENLRMFRVGRLKIDRRFIEGVLTDPGDAAIVRAMIGLARQLGIEVVAEGVETAEQRAFLVSTGCEFAQGYFLGSPMPAALATACLQGGWPLDAV